MWQWVVYLYKNIKHTKSKPKTYMCHDKDESETWEEWLNKKEVKQCQTLNDISLDIATEKVTTFEDAFKGWYFGDYNPKGDTPLPSKEGNNER